MSIKIIARDLLTIDLILQTSVVFIPNTQHTLYVTPEDNFFAAGPFPC
jgi:hypothetical protein